jgi:two-component system chemotaxis sensor kinase CheA
MPEPCGDQSAFVRRIHTLKGNSAMFGLTSLSAACHELETKLLEAEEGFRPEDWEKWNGIWNTFAAKVRLLAGTGPEDRIELRRVDLQSLRQGIASGRSSTDLLRLLRNIEREPAERRLARISEQAKALARRLGKGEIVVATESNDVRMDPNRWSPFWAAFAHMLRNALDHGLERPEERVALGKPPTGRLALRARQSDNQVIVEISDDGRGIDWDKIRSKGAELGFPIASDEDVQKILFRGGVSSKDAATEVSGRGAGVSASYNACVELGGTVTLQTSKGAGTTFRFTIPADDALDSAESRGS